MTRPSLRKSTKLGRPAGSGKLVEYGPTVIKYLRMGVPVRQTCKASGLSYETYKEWMRLGEDPKSPYFKFREEASKARAEAVVRNVGIIQKAATENWTAAAWYLERCYPEDFGRRNPDVAVAIQNNTTVGVVNSPEVKNLASELCSIIRKTVDAEYKEENGQ